METNNQAGAISSDKPEWVWKIDEDITLRPGDRGIVVGVLQKMLHHAGYAVPTENYIYAPSVTQAVMRFERQNGLKVDGHADPEVRELLAERAASPSPSGKTFFLEAFDEPTTPILAPGPRNKNVIERGEHVQKYQAQLKEEGFYKQEPTGFYTDETWRAAHKAGNYYGTKDNANLRNELNIASDLRRETGASDDDSSAGRDVDGCQAAVMLAATADSIHAM